MLILILLLEYEESSTKFSQVYDTLGMHMSQFLDLVADIPRLPRFRRTVNKMAADASFSNEGTSMLDQLRPYRPHFHKHTQDFGRLESTIRTNGSATIETLLDP